MRTTVALDPDVAAAVERLRRERGMGVSSALNQLARQGLAASGDHASGHFAVQARPLVLRVDVRNVAEALDELEGPSAR